MKNKFTKIISILLILSLLTSFLTVFATASDAGADEEQTEEDPLTVIYNRDFNEGWNYNNGVAAVNATQNKLAISEEEDYINGYNYFLDFEVQSASNVYIQMSFQHIFNRKFEIF